MKERKQKEAIILNSLNRKESIVPSQETREKSLLAFKDGLNQTRFEDQTKNKPLHLKKRVIGMSSTVVAAGIAGILLLSTGILGSENIEDESRRIAQKDEENKNYVEDQADDAEDLLEIVWSRPSFDYNDLNGGPTKGFFNGDLKAYLPHNWTINESEEDQVYSIHMAGSFGAEMNLVLFDQDYEQETYEAQLQDLTADFTSAEKVSIPIEEFINEIRISHEMRFPYEDVFPFETESAEITAFIDEENGKFMELYISELFGYPMIFTSELPLDDKETWTIPIQFLTFISPNTPFTIHDSEGEHHPEFNRPMEKSVLLQVGASGVEEVNMELYENEEINMTSYLPSNTEIKRIEHEQFTEWRFTEPNVSENSFYAFGKLKNGFPVENGKEIMFEAFDIDLSYSEDLGGPIPHHYSYYSGMEDDFIDGYIELFEVNGEWYYKHKHADRHDYNGGVYMQRLDFFIRSMEWH